jgi:glutaredoxin 3
MTAAVTIYTTESCAFCLRAKDYLRSKGVFYREVDVTDDDGARADLVKRSNGQRTVPQIFVGDVHVGGYTDLVRLDAEGKFRPLLSRA